MKRPPQPAQQHRGAALLMAMLTVMLVATLASAALWQQWRSIEIESAERQRTQLAWVLTGALDWTRLILQEDARSSGIDHLSEPWALPLAEARLSSFLAMDKNNNADTSSEAFLSGQISDQQALLNLNNLVDNGKRSDGWMRVLTRLFSQLNLPRSELTLLSDGLLRATQAAGTGNGNSNNNTNNGLTPLGRLQAPIDNSAGASQPDAPLLPQRVAQLVWLGVSAPTVAALTPYVTLLPGNTPVNLNTASAPVLQALVPGLDTVQAQQFVAQRAFAHFPTLTEAINALHVDSNALDTRWVSVSTRYFAVRGRLRLDDTTVQEVSLVERQSNRVQVLWRAREVLHDAPDNTGGLAPANTPANTPGSRPNAANPSLQ